MHIYGRVVIVWIILLLCVLDGYFEDSFSLLVHTLLLFYFYYYYYYYAVFNAPYVGRLWQNHRHFANCIVFSTLICINRRWYQRCSIFMSSASSVHVQLGNKNVILCFVVELQFLVLFLNYTSWCGPFVILIIITSIEGVGDLVALW